MTDASRAYGQRIMNLFDDAGLRAVFDDRPERLERKVVDAREQRIPLFVAVGPRDEAAQTLSVRLRDGTQHTWPIIEGVGRLREMAQTPFKVRPDR